MTGFAVASWFQMALPRLGTTDSTWPVSLITRDWRAGYQKRFAGHSGPFGDWNSDPLRGEIGRVIVGEFQRSVVIQQTTKKEKSCGMLETPPAVERAPVLETRGELTKCCREFKCSFFRQNFSSGNGTLVALLNRGRRLSGSAACAMIPSLGS